MKKPKHDARQLDLLGLFENQVDLIEVPEPTPKTPGALDIDQKLRRAVSDAIDKSAFSRDQIADMVSELAGRKVTKATLDTFTGASRPNRMPADLLPALTSVLGPTVLNFISNESGCRLIERQEAAFARIGQLYLVTLQAQREQEETLKKLPLFLGSSNG